MNQQWLTTLMSKGLELEQTLRHQVKSAKDEMKSKLEERGVRLSAADLTALIEEISPKASRAALSYALDVLRPFSMGMGLRLARLSDTQIEIVVPARAHNLNEQKCLHEGAIATAVIEAAKILWMRHAPLGDFRMSVSKMNVEFFKQSTEECRVRMELSEAVREALLFEIREQRSAQFETEVKIFDEHEQAIANVQIHFNLKHTPAIQQ